MENPLVDYFAATGNYVLLKYLIIWNDIQILTSKNMSPFIEKIPF